MKSSAKTVRRNPISLAGYESIAPAHKPIVVDHVFHYPAEEYGEEKAADPSRIHTETYCISGRWYTSIDKNGHEYNDNGKPNTLKENLRGAVPDPGTAARVIGTKIMAEARKRSAARKAALTANPRRKNPAATHVPASANGWRVAYDWWSGPWCDQPAAYTKVGRPNVAQNQHGSWYIEGSQTNTLFRTAGAAMAAADKSVGQRKNPTTGGRAAALAAIDTDIGTVKVMRRQAAADKLTAHADDLPALVRACDAIIKCPASERPSAAALKVVGRHIERQSAGSRGAPAGIFASAAASVQPEAPSPKPRHKR